MRKSPPPQPTEVAFDPKVFSAILKDNLLPIVIDQLANVKVQTKSQLSQESR